MKLTVPVASLLIGLSMSGVAAAILYVLLKKEEEADSSVRTLHKVKTSRTVLHVKIPKHCVGAVIGRAGKNIKDIQDQANVRITFKDDAPSDPVRTCIIQGQREATQYAEALIHEFIRNQPLIERHEMFVPSSACGRIIGKGGCNVRSIMQQSGTKVSLGEAGEQQESFARRVLITGTAEQIAVALSLIEAKVQEDEQLRREVERGALTRSPRQRSEHREPLLLMAAEEASTHSKEQRIEKLVPASSGGFLEVYLSALESPARFWLQVIGPRAVQLDHLEQEMAEYYEQQENRDLHRLDRAVTGQLVAAPFMADGKWYRAEVRSLEEDDYASDQSKLTLFFLDYGDTSTCAQSQACQLRTEFLRLPFQAIECELAKVKPRGAEWTSDATDLFEDLTHVAQWKVMMACIQSYQEREGNKVPCVELYDTSGAQDVDVAAELVQQGHAQWDPPQDAPGVWRHPAPVWDEPDSDHSSDMEMV